jgi:two-component system LytT family response regulator
VLRPRLSDALRVALVDDEPLGRERIRVLLSGEPDVSLVGEYRAGEDAVVGLRLARAQVLFLDVQMPGLDGFGVVSRLEAMLPPDDMPVIVFVTAHDAYALRAFDVSATDYLLKPFDRERFRNALERARVRVRERGRADARFVVRSGSRIYFVRAADVDWIGGEGNYARLHAAGKRHLVRETLKSVEARLDPHQFVRVHRSAIVNVDRIATLQPHSHGQYLVTMKDGARLTSSRSHSGKLRSLIRPVPVAGDG